MEPPDLPDPVPPPPTYGPLEPTPAQRADSTGWVILFAGIVVGMVVVAAAAVGVVVLLSRR